MLVIGQLPEREFFLEVPTLPQQDGSGKRIWVDKHNSFFRVVADNEDPFNEEQEFLIYTRWGKSNKSKYLLGIDFRNTNKKGFYQPVEIRRTIYKGKSAYVLDSVLRLWAIPVKENQWLQYTLNPK